MPATINVPEELMPYFVDAAGNVDLSKVAIFISRALNMGSFENVYSVGERQRGLDVYRKNVPRGFLLRNIIGRITVVLTPQFRYLGFFANTNEWQEDERYFEIAVKTEINKILEKIYSQKRGAIAHVMRDRLSELNNNPFFEDRNSSIQVMQYLGVHKVIKKPKSFFEALLYGRSSPKAGDKRFRQE